MKFKILSILLIQLSFFIGFTQAQDSRYLEEKTKVFQFFQDSIFTNQRYFPYNGQSDTIFIRNFLSNHGLFVQLKANLLNPEFRPKDLQPPNLIQFTQPELKFIFDKTQLDNTKEELGFSFQGNINVVTKHPKSIEISKPVFLRNFSLCFISFKNINRKREIFGPVYNLLLVKREGKWAIASNTIDLMDNYIDDDDF